MPPLAAGRRAAVLATVCLAVFAINLDVTIVNVALPGALDLLAPAVADLALPQSPRRGDWLLTLPGYTLEVRNPAGQGGIIKDHPRRYELRVRGRLGETIRSAFPALQARTRGNSTVLAGVLADQAALYGVLTECEALGLELLEVRCLEPDQ
jgi:hypothetical protein